METCPNCKKEYDGQKAQYNCPYCGRGRWLEITITLLLSAACIGLIVFAVPMKIASIFWRVIVYIFTVSGAIMIFPGLGGLFKGLRARRHPIETPSQQPENLTPEGQARFKEAQRKDTEAYLQPYYFFSSPNPSLMDALHTLFQARPQPFIHKVGRGSIRPEVLLELKTAAADLPFSGEFFVLNQSKMMKSMTEVVHSMANQSLGHPLHIVSVSIDRAGEDWMQDVFKTFTEEAMKQGIMPPHLYMTDSAREADYLIGISQPGS